MKKWFQPFLVQMPIGYDASSELKLILNTNLNIHWIQNNDGILHFKIEEELPNLILDRMIHLLKISLKKYLPEYLVEINNSEVLLKRKLGWFNLLLSLNFLTQWRITKFKSVLTEDISELKLFYNVNRSKMNVVAQQTQKSWRLNVDVRSIPYQAWYSNEGKICSLPDWRKFNFIHQVVQYENETRIYPRITTSSLHDFRKNFEEYSYPYRNEILTIASKILYFGISCLPAGYDKDEYEIGKFFLQSATILILLKFTIGYLDRKIIKWSLIPNQKNDLKAQKFDQMLSILTLIPARYTIGVGNSILPLILDFIINDLYLRPHPEESHKGIADQQFKARENACNIIQYLFPNKKFNFELNQYFHSKALYLDINIENLQLTPFELEIFLKILPDSLKFFDIMSDIENKKLTLKFPPKFLELGRSEKFTNIMIAIIQEISMIAYKLNKFNINKELWEIYIFKKYSQHRGAILLKLDSINHLKHHLANQFSIETKKDKLMLTLPDQDLSFNIGLIYPEYKTNPTPHSQETKPESEEDSDSNSASSDDLQPEASYNGNSDTTSEDKSSDSDELQSITYPEKIERPKIIKKVLLKINLVRDLIKSKGYVRTIMNGKNLEVYLSIAEIEERLKGIEAIFKKSKNGLKITLTFANDISISITSMVVKDLKPEKAESPLTRDQLISATSFESKNLTTPVEINLKAIMPNLMREFGQAFHVCTNKHYNFLQRKNDIITIFFETFAYFSYMSYLVNPKVTVGAGGSSSFAPLVDITPGDLDCSLFIPADIEFNAKYFFDKLLENKSISKCSKSPLTTVDSYYVTILNTEIEVRIFDKNMSNGLSLCLSYEALYLSIIWSNSPEVKLETPPCAMNFVAALRKGQLPPLEIIQNFVYAKFLANSQLKSILEHILLEIYPDNNYENKTNNTNKKKKKIQRNLNRLEKLSGDDGTLDKELTIAILSILNLISDVKRLFRLQTAMHKIKFFPNEFLSKLMESCLTKLLVMAHLVHPHPPIEAKSDNFSFKEILFFSLQKHFIKTTGKKPITKSQTKHFVELAKSVLCFDGKTSGSNIKTVEAIFNNTPAKIFSDPKILNYYLLTASTINSLSKGKGLLNLLLITATLTQISEFFPTIKISTAYDAATYKFVLENTLLMKFKEKLAKNAASCDFIIDQKSLSKPASSENITEILVNKWQTYQAHMLTGYGYHAQTQRPNPCFSSHLTMS